MLQRQQDRYNLKLKGDVKKHHEATQRQLALWLGMAGVGLPSILIFSSCVLDVQLRDSLSHYYYVKFLGDIFAGFLIAIGAFLIAYRGFNDKEGPIATVSGIAAFGIVLFPTSKGGTQGYVASDSSTFLDGRVFIEDGGALVAPEAHQLFMKAELVHYAFVALLFGSLIYLTWRIFMSEDKSRVQRDENNNLMRNKKIRNRLYFLFATLTAIGVAALVGSTLWKQFGTIPAFWNDYNLTLVFEALALGSFGVIWLVNARATLLGRFDLSDPYREN